MKRAARKPAPVAADVVLLFPDREAALDLVDDETAGGEGLGAVHGGGGDEHAYLSDFYISDPVGRAHIDSIFFFGFMNDIAKLTLG
jgi:hypothetical protein